MSHSLKMAIIKVLLFFAFPISFFANLVGSCFPPFFSSDQKHEVIATESPIIALGTQLLSSSRINRKRKCVSNNGPLRETIEPGGADETEIQDKTISLRETSRETASEEVKLTERVLRD